MAVCHVLPGGVPDLHGMVGKIFNQLLKESIDQSWYSKVADFFGNKVRGVGFFGVSVKLGKTGKPEFKSGIDGKELNYIADRAFSDSKGLIFLLNDLHGA